MKHSSEIPKKVYELLGLAKEVKGNDFPHRVLRGSLSDLIYILERIEALIETSEKGWSLSDEDETKAQKIIGSSRLIDFYSRCLLLWGVRILYILNETHGLKIPHDIRLARNILAAHYGVARGKLKSKLSGVITITIPKISQSGNLTYSLGPLGGPSSIASKSELLEIKELYKKYCNEKSEPNIWQVCYKILCQDNIKISEEDLPKIENFLRNNGGTFTTSFRIVDFIIKSLNQIFCKMNP